MPWVGRGRKRTKQGIFLYYLHKTMAKLLWNLNKLPLVLRGKNGYNISVLDESTKLFFIFPPFLVADSASAIFFLRFFATFYAARGRGPR